MIQRKIPVVLRVPLALLLNGVIAFGPIYIAAYLFKSFLGMVLFGAIWLSIFQRYILWRLDCFWNLRTLQNKTGLPPNPDN